MQGIHNKQRILTQADYQKWLDALPDGDSPVMLQEFHAYDDIGGRSEHWVYRWAVVSKADGVLNPVLSVKDYLSYKEQISGNGCLGSDRVPKGACFTSRIVPVVRGLLPPMESIDILHSSIDYSVPSQVSDSQPVCCPEWEGCARVSLLLKDRPANGDLFQGIEAFQHKYVYTVSEGWVIVVFTRDKEALREACQKHGFQWLFSESLV